jgi:ABC-type antimicrobial peptide transport system permease subunit
MKTSMYFNYTSRSLWRGGQRTVLAVFCVAVGVMAIVALQLVGLMINSALTSNVRDANGGDLSVSSISSPFTQSDLSYFNGLKSSGALTNYTALDSLTGSFSNAISATNGFTVLLVDPRVYPLVTPPRFNNPAKGSIRPLLTGNGAIIDQTVADTYHKRVGQTLDLHVSSGQTNSQRLSIRIAGVAADTGVLSQYKGQGVMLVSQSSYQQVLPSSPLLFSTIKITTASAAQADTVAKQVTNHFFTATTQTVADALKARQSLVDGIKKFLEIAGLLALLIGGVGIVNTMQVLLSRRKVEIAMLKTTGYRRTDLYLLFGLEAGLLGLIGGVLGSAAAIGVSDGVRTVVQQGFGLDVPFLLNWPTITGGVLIGLCTALIFGLMPIVQAANIRPLSVIRELPESNRAGSVLLTIVLLLILSVLFCVLSVIILNDVGLGIGAVYGTFVFLLILSGFFTLVAFLVSKLPVPENFSIKFLALVFACAFLSILLALALPPFGLLLLGLTILGFLSVLMPRTWKANTRMALRNIGRQRARTTTTLLALFVGIFTIGLILVLGQNLRDSINTAIASDLTYNVVTNASGPDASALQAQINSVPGLQKYTQHYLAQTTPVEINGQPLQTLLQNVPQNPNLGTLGRVGVFGLLSGVEGYDVANGSLPVMGNGLSILSGRNLHASDAGSNNVLISSVLTTLEPLKGKLGVGSTITLLAPGSQTPVTLTVVGIYQSGGFNLSLGSVFAPKSTVQALSPHGVVQSVFYMKVDPTKVKPALARISVIAPNAGSFNLANIGDFINQYLNYMILILITIASLSLLAGVIIIANAVALAMLERRRELGILKAVGYTSSTVMGEVLIENAAIGGLGAMLAMLLVTLVTGLLGHFFFKSSFSVNNFVIIGLIAGSALLAVITALLVAWGSVRVRPLTVLRYE